MNNLKSLIVKPSISIIIPTLNEEKNIEKCLRSIFNQVYPKNRIEALIVDDDSIDRTVEIARKYPVRILRNGHKHGEIGKMIGFRAAKGEYCMYLDADIELRGKNWLKKIVKPLVENPNITGSFTKYYSKVNTSPIERYLNFDPLQRDQIYQFFSPSIEDTIKSKIGEYYICEYKIGNIPPAGLCLFRRKELLDIVENFEMFLELDFLVLLVKNGFNKFVFVPEAGLYHHHVTSLFELLRKRKYNLTKVYFSHVKNNLYTWIDWKNPLHLSKLVLWIIYANLFFPSLITGIYKSFKYRDWAGLYEPIVNLLVTDLLIISFLIHDK